MLDNEWLKSWQIAIKKKESRQLSRLLQQAPQLQEEFQIELFPEALKVAALQSDMDLLTDIFQRLNKGSTLRAQALTAALELANERESTFHSLLKSLNEGETLLILSTLLDASRIDLDPERRLYRLNLILELNPHHVHPLYWEEAHQLALQGGDDAKLILLAFAAHLSPAERKAIIDHLDGAVSRLKEPFKHAQAAAFLLDLGIPKELLALDDVYEAARAIPNHILRVATQSKLEKLLGGSP